MSAIHMQNDPVRSLLRDALIDVRNRVADGSIDGSWGICDNLRFPDSMPSFAYSAVGVLLPQLFGEWPEFSGSEVFPVPNTTGWRTPSKMYVLRARSHTLWTGRYGAARKRLLNYCIDMLA